MDYWVVLWHPFGMGRKALKIDETSLMCSRYFDDLRKSKKVSMYRIKSDFDISNGRVDRLFQQSAVWTLDDFASFCTYFKVDPVKVIGHIEKEKGKSGSSSAQVSALVPKVRKPVKDDSTENLRLVAQKSKSKTKIGSETDEGFDSA